MKALTAVTAYDVEAQADRLSALAVRALIEEARLSPKPGLVDSRGAGAHRDLSLDLMERSARSLQSTFYRLALHSWLRPADAALRQEIGRLGREGEQQMMAATGGVNTHRGAIFCLGMVCAALASCHGRRIALSPAAVRAELLSSWGDALVRHAMPGAASSHGLQAAARYAVGGAREEGALGFPAVFEVGLPRLQASLQAGRGDTHARIDALFALMAQVSDTNVYHRGAAEGAAVVKLHGQRFIDAGGTGASGWLDRALDSHAVFTGMRLSPGGAADLLAAACLVHQAILAQAAA